MGSAHAEGFDIVAAVTIVAHNVDCRPAAKYAPWFSVPLTSARLAVKVIGMLSEEARASRLSFNDVIKKLSEQPSSSSTFISKKVRCHGMCCAAEEVEGGGSLQFAV